MPRCVGSVADQRTAPVRASSDRSPISVCTMIVSGPACSTSSSVPPETSRVRFCTGADESSENDHREHVGNDLDVFHADVGDDALHLNRRSLCKTKCSFVIMESTDQDSDILSATVYLNPGTSRYRVFMIHSRFVLQDANPRSFISTKSLAMISYKDNNSTTKALTSHFSSV